MASPDSIIPDPTNPQQLNRYAYSLDNPIKFTDPTGHCVFAFPFDTLGCVIVALTLVIDQSVNDRPATLVSKPADVEGLPNILVGGESGSAGLGVGMEAQVSTYYDVESDTSAIVSCGCAGYMTPNLGVNKSLGVAWSEGVDSARDIAEGFSMSTGMGVSFVTGSLFTGAEPIIEPPQQSGLLASINSTNSNWHPPLMPEPGITGFTLGFGPSFAPVSFSSLACQCTVLDEGTLSEQYTPLPVKAYNWIYDWVEN